VTFNYHGPMKKLSSLVNSVGVAAGIAVGIAAGAAALGLAALPVQAQAPAPTPPAAPAAEPPAAPASAPASLAEDKAALETTPSSALDSALFYQLLIGEITTQGGEPSAGFALMLDAARKTKDAQLYQRAADIALQSRSGDAALQAAQAWSQAMPESREANRYVLQILIALGKIEETAEPLKTELRLSPDIERLSVLASIPRAYARAADKSAAGAVVEKALASYLNNPANPGVSSAAWTTVSRMRIAAGDSKGALDAAQRGQAANAIAEGPALVALELMEPLPAEGERIVLKYLDGNAKALPEIRMGYARALLDAQRYAEASAQLQLLTREKPEFPDAWLVLGSLQLQDNQLTQAQTSLERYVALAQQQPAEAERSRGIAQAYLSLSQVAEKRKDYAAAEKWLSKIENSEDMVQAQTRRASILASQGKLEQGRQLIRQLPEKTPAEARVKVNAEIGLLRDAKQYRLAYDALAQALVKSPKEPELLYDQAMMAEKLGQLDDMERLLRQVIALKPDYHHAYNALGYSLAERNIRLTEAKELIRQALTYAPTDPFIKDSMGWVEFRMGNTAEATAIFEAAYKAKPDAEIAAHYGEVLWSTGQRDRAIAIWKEGKMINPENETLLETLKRLRVKL
jgi:tetratricopeptide (TPR) repeat protein